MSCSRTVRCEAFHALLEEGSGGPRGLPGLGPYISCQPAGGISWLIAHGVASYVKMKDGTAELCQLLGSACAMRGLGWWLAVWQSLE